MGTRASRTTGKASSPNPPAVPLEKPKPRWAERTRRRPVRGRRVERARMVVSESESTSEVISPSSTRHDLPTSTSAQMRRVAKCFRESRPPCHHGISFAEVFVRDASGSAWRAKERLGTFMRVIYRIQ